VPGFVIGVPLARAEGFVSARTDRGRRKEVTLMTTRFAGTSSAPRQTPVRRLGLGLAAFAAAALLAASAPVPVLGPDSAAACQTGSSCGG
jgi:hypothetical protein